MMLLLSLILALLPLLAIVWMVFYGAVTTVDGLFMGLILAAISGVFALNAFLELRKGNKAGVTSSQSGRRTSSMAVAEGTVQRGRVESVQFFEAHVGHPNKSIVVLSDGSKSSNLLALEGDVRNALPVGQTVEITLRKELGKNVLVNVNYA
jgi:hypothetical protein